MENSQRVVDTYHRANALVRYKIVTNGSYLASYNVNVL